MKINKIDIARFEISGRKIISFNSNYQSSPDSFLDILKRYEDYLIFSLKGNLKGIGNIFARDTITKFLSIGKNKIAAKNLVAVQLSSGNKKNAELLIKQEKLKYYEKYHAKIAKVNCFAGQTDLLTPWNIYLAKLQFDDHIIIHKHKKLKNILLFRGTGNTIIGYVIIYLDKKYVSYPVVAGDIVIVSAHILHNITPLRGEEISFYVINDTNSEYEVSDTSDYHNEDVVSFKKLIVQNRDNFTPTLIQF